MQPVCDWTSLQACHRPPTYYPKVSMMPSYRMPTETCVAFMHVEPGSVRNLIVCEATFDQWGMRAGSSLFFPWSDGPETHFISLLTVPLASLPH